MGKKLKPDVNTKRTKMKLWEVLPELKGSIIRLVSNKEAEVDGCRGVCEKSREAEYAYGKLPKERYGL